MLIYVRHLGFLIDTKKQQHFIEPVPEMDGRPVAKCD